MSNDVKRIERLKQKYGAVAIENGMRLRPDDFLEEVEWRDRIDQHYTRALARLLITQQISLWITIMITQKRVVKSLQN